MPNYNANHFYISLLSVPFDNSYTNTVRFNTREEQAEYFQLDTRFVNATGVNMNIGTLLTTTLVVNCDATIQLNPVMNYNYCIIKNMYPGADLPYYFYFVTNIRQQSGNQIKLDVELDVIQTYYIDLEFEDCIINRAHLNRFKEDDAGNIVFDLSYQSKLFNRETETVPQRVKVREPIILEYDSAAPQFFNSYFNDFQRNGGSWIYVYINSTAITRLGTNNFNSASGQPLPFGVLVAPTRPIPVRIGDRNLTWNIDQLQKIIDNDNVAPYVLSYKVSPVAPFDYSDQTSYYSRSPFTLVTDGAQMIDNISFAELAGSLYAYVEAQPTGAQAKVYMNNWAQISFYKSEIVGKARSSRFNPKILNSDYKSFTLCDYAGNSFNYDIMKLDEEEYTIVVEEVLTPDITKSRAYIKTDLLNGALGVRSAVNKNYYGLVTSNDTQFPYTVSQLDTFLANNKNFALQQQTQRDYNTASVAIGAAASVAKAGATLNISKIVGAGIGAAGDAAQTYLKNELSRKNESFTIDNARNAPDAIKNAQGNVFFCEIVNGFTYFYEIREALPVDIQKIDDYMYKFGYSYELIDNIKNVDNIRHYFNFVQAALENITFSSNISNSVHDKIKNIFANGIRFWNYNNGTVDFKYTMENYENWLDTVGD